LGKFRLDIEYDYDFLLVGISCHEKAYRLCWALNNVLTIDLERGDDLAITLKKVDPPSTFTFYVHENNEQDTACFLVANRGETPGETVERAWLVTEQKQADYFFVAKGPFSKTDEERMLQGIRQVPFVLMSFPIDPESLKSKQNLVF
jgi:hypothetical protein